MIMLSMLVLSIKNQSGLVWIARVFVISLDEGPHNKGEVWKHYKDYNGREDGSGNFLRMHVEVVILVVTIPVANFSIPGQPLQDEKSQG